MPTTEEELEDLGEKADRENIAKKYMDAVRRRKVRCFRSRHRLRIFTIESCAGHGCQPSGRRGSREAADAQVELDGVQRSPAWPRARYPTLQSSTLSGPSSALESTWKFNDGATKACSRGVRLSRSE